MGLSVGQEVLVDGIRGVVTALYPQGKLPYTGTHHAYLWVSTPSLNYTEHHSHRGEVSFSHTRNGRAVPYTDIAKRIELVMDADE